jgi:hypothetical protein
VIITNLPPFKVGDKVAWYCDSWFHWQIARIFRRYTVVEVWHSSHFEGWAVRLTDGKDTWSMPACHYRKVGR